MSRRDFIKAGGAVMGMGMLSQRDVLAETLASGGKRPNILLLFSDQHNAGVLQCAGHSDVKTPNLDNLAAQGVRFSRAYCQNGICVPSRASMMTGQYCNTLGALDNAEDYPGISRFLPLPKHLQANGYRTAAFGKRHLPRSLDEGFDRTCTTMPKYMEPSDEYYWDWVEQQGQLDEFERDWQAEFGREKSAPLASRISDLKPENTMETYTARKTIDFLRDANRHDQPFFCWSSFYRPHQPYTPLPKYAEMYDPESVHLPPSLYECVDNIPPELRAWRNSDWLPFGLAPAARDIALYRRYISYYYALVAEIDDHVGTILSTLDDEGLAKDTIVIYAADHGDFVGAHGMAEKCARGHNVYEDTIRVPLIIRYPGITRTGSVSNDLVELIDLYPTLLDLTGVKRAEGCELPGKTLMPVLKDGTRLGRRYAVTENGSQVTLVGDRYKLGIWTRPQEGGYPDMLLDRQRDPYETYNFAGDPELADIEKEMRDHLTAIRGTGTDASSIGSS